MLSREKNILALVIYVIGMFILPVVVILIVAAITGIDLIAATREEQIYLTTVSSIISYGMLTLSLLILTRNVFKQDFKKIGSWGNFAIQMVLGVLCTYAAAVMGAQLVQFFGTNDPAANQVAIEAAINAIPFGMILVAVIFAPISEEIIFRLVLMKWFNWKPVYHILFSSFAFGLMHVLVGGLLHIIPYFLMGLVFGIIYHKNDNIWHATVLHMLHNGLSVVMLFMLQGML